MKNRSHMVLTILLFLQFSFMGTTYSQVGKNRTLNDTIIQALNREAPQLLQKLKVPAAGVAIIENGKIMYKGVFGLQSPDRPANDKTLFNVASLTKPIALETLLRLIAAGKISLDEPMWKYWVDPDIKNDPRHKLLTPRIALSHQTGFGNWRTESQDSILKFNFEPGTAFGYSGEGFNYVCRFTEKKLGKSFEVLAQQYVFDPIGMKNTSFSSRPWMTGRNATPADNKGVFKKPEIPAQGKWDAANNLSITIKDYALFLASVINGEKMTKELKKERITIYRSTKEKAPCKLEPMSLCPTYYGMCLGWERFDFPSTFLMMHLGGNLRPDGGGEATITYYYPNERRGIVILTSGRNGEAVFLSIMDIIDPNWPLGPFFKGAN